MYFVRMGQLSFVIRLLFLDLSFDWTRGRIEADEGCMEFIWAPNLSLPTSVLNPATRLN